MSKSILIAISNISKFLISGLFAIIARTVWSASYNNCRFNKLISQNKRKISWNEHYFGRIVFVNRFHGILAKKLQLHHSVEITGIHSHAFFDKNFVKVTVLLKKLLNKWFDEFFFQWESIFVFSTVWFHYNSSRYNGLFGVILHARFQQKFRQINSSLRNHTTKWLREFFSYFGKQKLPSRSYINWPRDFGLQLWLKV